MRKVCKYKFPFGDNFGLQLPSGAEVLNCNKIGKQWFLWALVDTEYPTTPRNFRIAGTDRDIKEENLHYITTRCETIEAQTLVWHIFEVK